MPDVLFVYGSLRSEFDNPHALFLRANAESVGRATVRGSLFLVGKYPGYLREPDGIVLGEFWRLRNPETTLAALDDYEGSEYSRVLNGNAWIYLYAGDVRPEQRIPSGDFLAR